MNADLDALVTELYVAIDEILIANGRHASSTSGSLRP